jgi:hypothetical protein
MKQTRLLVNNPCPIEEDPTRAASTRPPGEPRPPPGANEFKVWRELSTRWADNDIYGHVNNTVFYVWFDTAVNGWLIDQGMLDIESGDPIGLVVETRAAISPPSLSRSRSRPGSPCRTSAARASATESGFSPRASRPPRPRASSFTSSSTGHSPPGAHSR